MTDKVFILVLMTYVSLVASSLAPFITKCKWDDTKCLKESTQKAIPFFADGIPELNVDQHDPLVIKHVDASTPNLKLIVTDIVVTGLKNCKAKKIVRNVKDSVLTVKLQCAVDFKGTYEMKGQLFVVPIEGHGALTAKVRSILINADVHYVDKIGKDGKTYWDVKSWKDTFELKAKSDVKFENLFPTNEFLRKTTEELISSNGNDVITEIGPKIIEALVAKVVDNLKKFFHVVPVEDLVQE